MFANGVRMRRVAKQENKDKFNFKKMHPYVALTTIRSGLGTSYEVNQIKLNEPYYTKGYVWSDNNARYEHSISCSNLDMVTNKRNGTILAIKLTNN